MSASTNGQPKQTLREKRAALRRERLRVALQLEQHQLKRAKQLLEYFSYWENGHTSVDYWERLHSRNSANRFLPPSNPSDRRHGQNWPLWQTETELDELRQRARILCATNSYAQGLLRNRTNYVIGKGFAYKAVVKKDVPDLDPCVGLHAWTLRVEAVVAATQLVIDRFLRLNRWNATVDSRGSLSLTGSREREVYRRVNRDGEALVEFFPQQNGEMLVRFNEPETLRTPPGATITDGWTFGIQHQMQPEEDVETPLAYFFQHPDLATPATVTDGGSDPERWRALGRLIPADEVLHLKGPETDSTLKRGTPYFAHDVAAALERARVLQRNASTGAAIRAATAEIWQHLTATRAEVQDYRSLNAEFTQDRVKPDGSSTTDYIEHYYPGMVRRIDAGQELVQPVQDNTASYLTGVQGDLQQAASAFAAPAYWLGDTINANYSNLETASAPPVKDGETEQEYYKAAFARVAWKAVQWAVDSGRLDRAALSWVDIQVEGPAVLHRNELEKTQSDQILLMGRVKSPQTVAMENGLDPEVEMANIEEFEQRFGASAGPLGMPDAAGQMPPGGAAPPSPFPESLVESYFQSCPRDASGRCKPQDSGDESGQGQANQSADKEKPPEQSDKGKAERPSKEKPEPKEKDEKEPAEKDKEPKEKEPKKEKEAWDGTIDQDAVSETGRSRHVATWDQYDSTSNNTYEHDIRVARGEYEAPNGESVDVYRWESTDENDDLDDRGEWTKDEQEARRDGERYAERSHEETPPPDDDDDDDYSHIDPDDIPEPEALPPPPKLEKKEKLGKSAAKVEADATVNKVLLDELSTKLFGPEGVADVASVVGAPDDATVRVVYAGDYKQKYGDDLPMPGASGVRVEIDHPKLGECSRFVGVDQEGRKFIKNEILTVKDAYQGEGLGTSIFSKQVENAGAEGFDYITTHAAGGPGGAMNGYYSWPRMGYNESFKSIATHNKPLAAKILDAHPKARSVSDIMNTPEGREWWKKNGGDLYNARFDVREGSWSRYALDKYVLDRSKRRA